MRFENGQNQSRVTEHGENHIPARTCWLDSTFQNAGWNNRTGSSTAPARGLARLACHSPAAIFRKNPFSQPISSGTPWILINSTAASATMPALGALAVEGVQPTNLRLAPQLHPVVRAHPLGPLAKLRTAQPARSLWDSQRRRSFPGHAATSLSGRLRLIPWDSRYPRTMNS